LGGCIFSGNAFEAHAGEPACRLFQDGQAALGPRTAGSKGAASCAVPQAHRRWLFVGMSASFLVMIHSG
jgi:hypothetical protein